MKVKVHFANFVVYILCILKCLFSSYQVNLSDICYFLTHLKYMTWNRVWTDLSHGEFFRQNPEISDETETEMLNTSFSVELTDGKNNHTEVCYTLRLFNNGDCVYEFVNHFQILFQDSQLLRCFICKKVVNAIIKRVNKKLQKVKMFTYLKFSLTLLLLFLFLMFLQCLKCCAVQ